MAEGSFNMADATYGRDVAGRKALEAELLADIDRAINTLTTAPEYTNFISTVQNNWAGEDADTLIEEFKKAVSNLAIEYKKYKGVIENALSYDAMLFSKMQSNIASTIAGTSSNIGK